jgi:Nucleotidyl transferase AbiEii toxin, Type IV TA system
VDPFHQQLARVALGAGNELDLVLAGGYAISAHGLTSRPSQDLDFATRSAMPMAELTERLTEIFRDAGYTVTVIEVAPLMARLMIVADGRTCEVDLLKEPIGLPVSLEVGPVLALDDAVGMKVAALHDRATHRDFIDVHAAGTRAGYAFTDLERLGAAHKPGFSAEELADRLAAVELRADQRFLDYGLTMEQIDELRRWTAAWVEDIRHRLASGLAGASGMPNSEPDWDDYLNEP